MQIPIFQDAQVRLQLPLALQELSGPARQRRVVLAFEVLDLSLLLFVVGVVHHLQTVDCANPALCRLSAILVSPFCMRTYMDLFLTVMSSKSYVILPSNLATWLSTRLF